MMCKEKLVGEVARLLSVERTCVAGELAVSSDGERK